MVDFKKDDNAESNGSCLQGYFGCSYRQLVALLGAPSSDTWGSPYDGDGKVSTEWLVRDEHDNVFTVYDYKETSLYDDCLPSVADFRRQIFHRWHIGGHGSCADFVAWLDRNINGGGT